MDSKLLENFSKESFAHSDELQVHLDRIDALSPGQRYEFMLPKSSNICAFVSQLSLLPYDGEFSGVGDIVTGSIIVQKGYSEGGGRSGTDPHSDYIEERIKPDRVIDDIHFHTHPFSKNDVISSLRNPIQVCLPSDHADKDNMLTLRKWAEDVNLDWKPIVIIGSNGYLSISESTGVRLEIEELQKAGVNEAQFIKIKQSLNLYPPVYFKNYGYYEDARGDELAQKGIVLYESFFNKNKKEQEQLIDEFIAINRHLFRTGMTGGDPEFTGDRMKREILTNSLRWLSTSYLSNIGLTKPQITLVQKMQGILTEVYSVDKDNGIQRIILSDDRN